MTATADGEAVPSRFSILNLIKVPREVIPFSFGSPDMRRLRLRFAWGTDCFAGRVGEELARETLRALKLEFSDVDNSLGNLNEALRARGGKRPDFLLHSDTPEYIAMVDAKYHETADLTRFALEPDDVEKYRNLKSYAEEIAAGARVEVVFFVFPQEALGSCFALVDLLEFDSAEHCILNNRIEALSIRIDDRLLDSKTAELLDRTKIPGYASR